MLYFAGEERLLASYYLQFPAYSIIKDYFQNSRSPLGPLVFFERPRAPDRRWVVLGRQVGFPIGVPASVLTANSWWIWYFSRNGFNVLTYKTVRSRQYEGNVELPHWVFVPSVTEPFSVEEHPEPVYADPTEWVPPGDDRVTTANSFGVPSASPDIWQPDIREALHVVHDDQLLIVSVMGDLYSAAEPDTALQDDFVNVAKLAEEAGAPIIELNLSCPNKLVEAEVQPPLCRDTRTTADIVREVRKQLRPETQLVAKLAYMPHSFTRNLLVAVGELLDGVSGINTLQRPVLYPGTETPVFPGRREAGVSGIAIRNDAKQFVSDVTQVRAELRLSFDIIGMGGVTSPRSFEELYAMGADAVQSASGSFANPFLALDCVRELGDTLPSAPPPEESTLRSVERILLMSLNRTRWGASRYELAANIGAVPLAVNTALRRLEDAGLVQSRWHAGEIWYSRAPKGACR
ncbi:MAG: dihydroorotate oxidase [Actinobacteria bacterium]|nr:dihydroorotate oxidase [Actinomycetota bacterium]